MSLKKCDICEPRDVPKNACFSSGPCAKYSGWTAPNGIYAGRSHRSGFALDLIKKTVALQNELLQIPDGYKVAVIDGSTTAAMEMLLWNLLGERPADVITHCVFSEHWRYDIVDELKIPGARAVFGKFPGMADVLSVDFRNDVVFCLSSTTSGVAFHDQNWIPEHRDGLTVADASSAVFCMDLDWSKLDATAFSWQKGLGGEAGFGVIVLSPRAIFRLQKYHPDRAIPRILRLINNGKINDAVFEGATINTPSMLCFEDYYNALVWAKNNGCLAGMLKKVHENYTVMKDWVDSQNDFSFLAEERFRAHHIVCLDIRNEKYQCLSESDKWLFLKEIVAFCEKRPAGYDFLGHAMTRPHLRIWCGPTVDAGDLRAFLPWMRYAYRQLSEKL